MTARQMYATWCASAHVIIVQFRVLIVDGDNEKKMHAIYYGVRRVRMRQSQGSGSFGRVVCGVEF